MKGFFAMAALAAFALLGLPGCGKDEKQDLAHRIILHPSSTNKIKLEWTIRQLPNHDTLIHGVMKEYYWSGSVKKSVEWKEGVKDGTAQSWYDNGNQQWMKSYDKGKKVKAWRLFYSDGNPWMILNYDKEGRLEGASQRWDRMDPGTAIEAVFTAGNCTSGDCNLTTLPEPTEDMPPANKIALARDKEILADFLD